MKKAYLIGDCHLSRVYEYHNELNENIDIKFWALAGLKIFNINFNLLENQLSSKTEIGNKDSFLFQKPEDGSLVILWIGYVDIRQNLPKHKNADEIIKKYVLHVKEYFKNCKVIFVEPLPQFDKMYLKYEGISASYSYEERIEQNNIFINSLKKYAKEFLSTIPINQNEIFNILEIKELNENVLRKIAPHPADSLSEEYNYKLYKFFINIIEKNI